MLFCMQWLYNVSIHAYTLFIRIAALFHPKAKLWWNGRRGWASDLAAWKATAGPKPVLWMHCASLGEFEQGRPVLEAIRKQHPDYSLVLTFFSPSGFEPRRHYNGADKVSYLPADTPANARHFLDIVRPEAVIFVKYEYWANYFLACQQRRIPLFVASAILRPDQRFFGVFKVFWKKILACVSWYFVQNDETLHLLESCGFHNATVCGDTRYDRVVQIAGGAQKMPEIERFLKDRFCIVVGSSWPEEEQMLADYWSALSEEVRAKLCLILVPHEIHESHVRGMVQLFPKAILYTEWEKSNHSSSDGVMIVNTMGWLSTIYQYAHVALVGGGFGKGIHNILEAAVWGRPVLFGPNYYKFIEAGSLLDDKGAFVVRDEEQLYVQLEALRTDKRLLESCSLNAERHVRRKAGATPRIIRHLEENAILK
jgi:3-deoxy-D-manno-octulosonic-acid transferase